MGEVVCSEMGVELLEYDFFDQFGQERKVGNRTVVFQNVWVKVALFEKGPDNCSLECRWERAVKEGGVDKFCDERQKLWKNLREEGSWNRIEFAGLYCHLFQSFGYIRFGHWAERRQWCTGKNRVGKSGLERCLIELLSEV